MRKGHIAVSIAFILTAILVSSRAPAGAQATNYEWSLVAQANVDECFQGDVNAPGGITAEQIAANNQSFAGSYPAGLTPAQIAACIANGYKPKVNQAYVWGITEDGSGNLWFGTAANVLCAVLNNYYQSVPPPFENSDYVCDAQQNRMEDYKPPRMYVYNPATNTLTDLTGRILLAGGASVTLLRATMGIRSAGHSNGVVFFGGLFQNDSTTPASLDVVMYAFNASTMQYLGAYVFDGTEGKPWYNNIRQWHAIDGNLFAGVGKPNVDPETRAVANGGALLRWTGTPDAPFSFVEVGLMDADIAYFVQHSDGHIYATTWGAGGQQAGMELYMSPPLNATTGLDPADANNWQVVWNLNQYEVEPAVQQGGGAIASYGGYLYFGTMQVPATSVLNFYRVYQLDPSTTTAPTAAEIFLGTMRPIQIFRTAGFDPVLQPSPSVQLLYGSASLLKYDPSTASFQLVANGMGAAPLYGAAGFGNIFNNYTWSMEVFHNQLYVGTMDFSYLVSHSDLGAQAPPLLTTLASFFSGADLWMFPDAGSPAALVNGAGMGNETTYGIRNLVADDNNLWLGMANPMNLRTDPENNPGGWKLIRMPIPGGAPIITWFGPEAIAYGTPLSATQLNATASVNGTFAYTPPLGAVLDAGSDQALSTIFTPYNSGNQYGASVKLTVNPAPLALTANNASMTYGSDALPILSGTVAGLVNNDSIAASYSTTATEASPPGSYPITVTASDPDGRLSNYAVTNTPGTLTVTRADTVSTLTSSQSSVLLQNPVTFAVHLASVTSGTPTGTVTFLDGAAAIGSQPLNDGSAQITVSTLALGTHSIAVTYPGDTNFAPGSSSAITEVVQDFQLNPSAGGITSATVLPGTPAAFSFTIAPTHGATFPNPVTFSLTGLPGGYTYTISPSTILAGSGATTVAVTVQTPSTLAHNNGLRSGLVLCVLFLPVLSLIGFRRRIRGAGLALLVLLGLAVSAGIGACGGPRAGYFARQSQTSVITVTGSSGSLARSVTLTLTVQ